MYIQSYQNLEVWKKSIALVKRTYAVTESFPKQEIYGLSAQLRRCAVSIPSNIAEGRGRRGTKEFLRYIDIAFGSLAELETQLFIAHELNYINNDILRSLLESTSEIGRMLNGLSNGLEKKLFQPTQPSYAECQMLDA